MEIDLRKWVESAPQDRILFRQAVHIILYAISSDDILRFSMVMKGGMLLGIRYSSSRFTTDIDFSTSQTLDELDEADFIARLSDALVTASDELPYQIECRLQTLKVKPDRKATFPGFKIKVGYAESSKPRIIERLRNGNSPSVIDIDYSLNEVSNEIEELVIEGDESIQAYAVTDIIAEKYRSIIQQIIRKRNRRQDVYDLWYLIGTISDFSNDEKNKILESLYMKSEGKVNQDEVAINSNTLDREDIIERSETKYSLLNNEVKGDFPLFKDAYQLINDFYKSLPWE